MNKLDKQMFYPGQTVRHASGEPVGVVKRWMNQVSEGRPLSGAYQVEWESGVREYVRLDELVHEPPVDEAAIAAARAWLVEGVNTVEAIIDGMPTDEQERYRRQSKPHGALA